MNADELKVIEKQQQALLEKLTAAETALRENLHTHGFGFTARDHMERAMAHVQEAYVAINEIGRARTVHQLVNDLARVEKVADETKRGHSQSI